MAILKGSAGSKNNDSVLHKTMIEMVNRGAGGGMAKGGRKEATQWAGYIEMGLRRGWARIEAPLLSQTCS